jgi:hypothetical protein
MAKEKQADMTFRVASFKFDKKEAAEKAAKVANEAADKVCLKMVVDGKTVTCDKAAEKACGAKTAGDGATCHHGKDGAKTAEHAKDATKTCEYMVSSDENSKITCPIMARVELAKARIAAAMKAIESTMGDKVAGGA